jgi:hypothetical protein
MVALMNADRISMAHIQLRQALDTHIGSANDNGQSTLKCLTHLHVAATDVEIATVDAVQKARHERVTWLEIGQALGITKQAAQQRYGHQDNWTAADTTAGLTPSMFSSTEVAPNIGMGSQP